MINKINASDLHVSNHGWLKSRFHFSFSEYYNPDNINFGVLRVLNDDIIKPNTGFDMHPHRDMEIITYVINGKLTHQDSMGNKRKITRGEVQYMSAGTGIYHSEHNLDNEDLRLFQLWIFPDKKDYKPNYGEQLFKWEERENKFFHMVSSTSGAAPIKINQDVNIFSANLKDVNIFNLDNNRKIYLVVAEGKAEINGLLLTESDALTSEESIKIKPIGSVHLLVIEMMK